jgi:demethylmenaquinone methyltransferase/2-methoxy-6-polyprenyl-1,4-benzoquinol methylase
LQISRVKRTKSTAKRVYDHLSQFYDLLAGPSETQFIHLGLEMLAVKAGEAILEIGSGTGKALLELCTQVGDQGKVNGLDLSPGMLRVAHNRLGNAGVHRQVSLLMGDGATLPYKNQAFSAVFMSFTLELFDTPEIPLVLAECQRVLQLDGRLGVVSMLKSEHPGRIVRLYEWFHKKLPAYVDCRPIDAQAMIQDAGFSLQKQQVKNMWGLPVAIMVARKK